LFILCFYTTTFLLLPVSFFQIDWFRYFSSIVPSIALDYLRTNPQIVIQAPAYFQRLSQLLQATNPRTLANDLLLRYTLSEQMGGKYEAATAVSANGGQWFHF
jgi:hypothetical protein